MEVLAAFIREPSREQWPPAEDGAASPDRLTSPDVQAAVTVIGRRTSRHDSQPIVLAGANLTRARLDGANLNYADLIGADLGGATSVPTGGSEGD
jgi:pentapeptide repeat protein